MQVGEQVVTLHGETKQITSILARPGPPEKVYNLEVNGEHTYFVGQQQLLVHNSCPKPILLGQDMPGRVIPVGLRNGYRTLDGNWTWERNRQFIWHAMRQARENGTAIFDIGRQQGRYFGPKSTYRREVQLLERNGFVREFVKWVKDIDGNSYRLYQWKL